MKSFRVIVGAVGLSLLLASTAVGQDRREHSGDRGGHGERSREASAPRGRDRGDYNSGGYSRGAYPHDRGPAIAPLVGRPMIDRACGDFVACRSNRSEYPGYSPGAAPYPRGGWRRGEFLPRPYWGGQVLDPHQYRLRTPPPGYGWYGIGPDAYLVQHSTGLILDTAPGGR